MQTEDAEITLQAHPQRAPVGGSGVKSGAANGPLRVRGNAFWAEYHATRGHASVAGDMTVSRQVRKKLRIKVAPRINIFIRP